MKKVCQKIKPEVSKMKRALALVGILVAVFFAHSLVANAWSLIDQIERLPGQMVGWTGTKNVPIRASNNGEIFTEASITSTTNKKANLATGTVTLLHSIASFTAPCVFEFSCPAGAFWTGDATTTVDLVKIHKMSAGDSKVIKVGTSSYNIGLIADTAVSSFAWSIHYQQ
jgi:hypothetical protein